MPLANVESGACELCNQWPAEASASCLYPIAYTIPDILDQLRVGDPPWIDDGKIG